MLSSIDDQSTIRRNDTETLFVNKTMSPYDLGIYVLSKQQIICRLLTYSLQLEDPNFQKTFMDNFFCKMNEENYLIVDSKLKDKNRDPVEFDPVHSLIGLTMQLNSIILLLHYPRTQDILERKTIRNKIIKSKTSTLRIWNLKTQPREFRTLKAIHQRQTQEL